VVGLEEAISSVKDGSTIAFGGFQLNRAPIKIVEELIRQKKKNLNVISLPNPLPLDMLIREGLVKSAKFSFNGFNLPDQFVISPHWRKAIETGEIEWEEVDAYAIVQGLRAGAMGVPFMPAPQLEKSDHFKFMQAKMIKDPFGNQEIAVVPTIQPDFAFIHAQIADQKGNVQVFDPQIDLLLAQAAKRVIVTVEEILENPLINSNLPYYYIKYLVSAPGGAAPCSCFPHYDCDWDKLKEYLKV